MTPRGIKSILKGRPLLGAIIFLAVLGSAENLSGQNAVICTYNPDSVLAKSGLEWEYQESIRNFESILQAKINTRTNCFPFDEETFRHSSDSTARQELRRLERERKAVFAEVEAVYQDFAKSEYAKNQGRMEQAAEAAGKKCGCMATWPKSMVLYGPTHELSYEVIAHIKADSSR